MEKNNIYLKTHFSKEKPRVCKYNKQRKYGNQYHEVTVM